MDKTIVDTFITNLSLMELPPELRLHIYGYLLRPRDRLVVEDLLLACMYDFRRARSTTTAYPFRCLSSRITLRSSAMATYTRSRTWERHWYGETLKIYTKVLSLNRKIRDEALECLYGQQLYFVCSPDGVEAFFKDRSVETLGYITDITLSVPSETGRHKFGSVCKFIAKELRLKKLNVWINTFLWDYQPWETIEKVEDAAERDGLFLKLDWVQCLLFIQNLEAINIEFDHRYAARGLTVGDGFTNLLQARMLKQDILRGDQL